MGNIIPALIIGGCLGCLLGHEIATRHWRKQVLQPEPVPEPAAPTIWFGKRYFTQRCGGGWKWPIYRIADIAEFRDASNETFHGPVTFWCGSLLEAQQLIERLDAEVEVHTLTPAEIGGHMHA